jgi:fructokinase
MRKALMTKVDVVGTGFTALDRVYIGSALVEAEDLGGSCGNVLISLAMLRRNVAPVLSLGEDEVGVRLIGAFRQAGAETRYIRQRLNIGSPVLAQHVNISSGIHSFTFRCPETHLAWPRYEPISREDVTRALPAIRNCSVFYTDRLSSAIIDAMESAAEAGSIVYFEPSEVGDEELFRRALAVTAVLKFSAERLTALSDAVLSEDTVLIITHGEAGLEVRRGNEAHWCPSHPATEVRDTCGSGDMVTVGVIDSLLSRPLKSHATLSIYDFLTGTVAGQRLAAANCAFVGARGLFRERGAEYARSILNG